MKGDFTRVTFDKEKHFSRVLMQQGRVQLDADWNEQVAVLLHYLHTLATDLIGPHGGPIDNDGFGIYNKVQKQDEQGGNESESNTLFLNESTMEQLRQSGILPLKDGNFLISKGRYYVDGLLCENDDYVLYSNQPDYMSEAIDTSKPFLFYLDVWERMITYIEDDAIREVALNGSDTAVRSQLVWQVKIENDIDTCDQKTWDTLVEKWQPENRGRLKVQAKKSDALDDLDPCTISPDAHYRGAENQLYRVEIHSPSPKPDDPEATGPATFKWSRENGSVTFPITAISGKFVTVENLGQDGRFSLKKDDWVEIVDDDYVLGHKAEALHRVDDVDPMTGKVELKPEPAIVTDVETKHPLLRRWDHKAGKADKGGLTLHTDGSALIEASNSSWLKLEDGIEIQFQPNSGEYRTGDYWLIPARTITGDVEWPQDENSQPIALPPHGIEHHYAPLAIMASDDAKPTDCRHQFGRLPTKDQTGAVETTEVVREVVPTNVLDALVKAGNPSEGNPFITKSELPKPQLTSAQVNAIKKATRASSKNPFITKADVDPKE